MTNSSQLGRPFRHLIGVLFLLTSIRPNSSYPSRKQKQHYFHPNSILPLVPMKYQCGFFARTHLFCVLHYAPFSIRLIVKASFLPCENLPTFYQFQNLLPPPISIQTFFLFHLPLFSVKSWNLFLTAGFFSQFQTKSIPSSSVLNEYQAQAWFSSTSCINGTKHVMILDHHYGSAF